MPKSRGGRDPQGNPGAVAFPWLPAMQPPTVEAAVRDATSTKVRFRRDAAYALRAAAGDQGAAAAEALRRMLGDADAVVRALAAESLAVRNDTAAREAIAQLAGDADEGVRAAAVEALGALVGDDLAPLRALLRHERPDVRGRVCAVLAEIGGEGVPDDLAGMLADKDARVRTSAIAALGWWHPRRHAAELRRALEDGDPNVRLAAAEALAFVCDDAGRAVLRQRVESGPFDEGWNQAFARLARLAKEEERPLFAARAKWPTRRLRRAVALAALARLGDAAARGKLRPWFTHRDPQRRGEALLAAGFARAGDFREELEREIRRPESPLFQTALIAAVQLGSEDLVPALVETARRTADRGTFDELAETAADLARFLDDRAPPSLLELAEAEFGCGTAGGAEDEVPEERNG